MRHDYLLLRHRQPTCDNFMRQPSARASDIRLRHTTYCRTGFTLRGLDTQLTRCSSTINSASVFRVALIYPRCNWPLTALEQESL